MSNVARDFFVEYYFDLKKFIYSKDVKTRESVSNMFDIILWKHVRIIKQIDIPHKLDNLFFDKTGTQENGLVSIIEIKLLGGNTNKKKMQPEGLHNLK